MKAFYSITYTKNTYNIQKWKKNTYNIQNGIGNVWGIRQSKKGMYAHICEFLVHFIFILHRHLGAHINRRPPVWPVFSSILPQAGVHIR